MKLARQIYHRINVAKARYSGASVGNGVCLSHKTQFRITGNSTVVVSDGVILTSNCQIDAHGNSNIYIGPHVHFGEGAKIHAHHGAHIAIEEGCSFNHGVAIFALESIIIGKDSIFGPYIYISDHNHQTSKECLIKDQGYDTEPIIIGSDVWMGVGATVIKGGSIGNGSIVAARAVVNKTIPDYEIWAGIPARKISERR